MRPIVSYYGSKSRLAPAIIAAFPPHHCFVEVCGGSAAVLMAKPPSKVEVLNDLDGDLVNLYRVLRDQPDEFSRLLKNTPYARDEHAACRKTFADAGVSTAERARRYFVAICQSYSGLVGDPFSRSRSKRTAATWKARVDRLDAMAERLRNVVIERRTAEKLVQDYDAPSTLFYVDPPYVRGQRSKRAQHGGKYRHEMSNDDHCVLLGALNRAEGNVLLSGYASPLYERLIGHWRVVWRRRVQQVSATALRSRTAQCRTEVLWANF